MQTKTDFQTILEMEKSKVHKSLGEVDSGHGGDGDVVGGEGHLDDVDGEGRLLPNGFSGAALEEREEPTPLPGEIP